MEIMYPDLGVIPDITGLCDVNYVRAGPWASKRQGYGLDYSASRLTGIHPREHRQESLVDHPPFDGMTEQDGARLADFMMFP